MTSTETAVISDDFTGGMMVAAMLRAMGVDCTYCTGPEHVREDPATVVATRSRFAPAAEAVRMFESVVEATMAAGYRHHYFKYNTTFDSTDEGNIGPCADLLVERLGSPLLVHVTGFPIADVSVFQGHLFVGTTLVSESDKRFDPLAPMPDPDLVRALQRQTPRRVGLLRHQVLAQGPQASARQLAALADAGVRHVIVDTVDEQDLRVIAEATAGWPLAAGSDALPELLQRARHAASVSPVASASEIAYPAGRGAVLVGSVSSVSRAQLADFAAHSPVFELDLLDPRDDDEIVAEVIDWARSQGDTDIAVSTAQDPEGVRATQSMLGAAGASARSEGLLARMAVALHADGVRRFVAVGGETSGAVVTALGIGRMHVAPRDELIASYGVSEGEDPVALMMKPGQVGDPGLFRAALQKMTAAHEEVSA